MPVVTPTVVTLAADTWGIPSGQFLLGYVLTAIVAVIASVALRASYMRAISRNADPTGVLTPAEVGMLFGDRRAVIAALALLRTMDLVDSTGRVARPLAARDRTLDPFTRCVYDRIAESGPQTIPQLTRSLTVPLAQLRASMVNRGLLAGRPQQQAARMAAVPIFLVVAVGVARIIAGIANGKPVFFLIFIVLPLVAIGLLVAKSSRRTRSGLGELLGASGRGARVGAANRYDRTNPAIAAAIGGGAALWLFDSTFASAAGVSPADGGGGFWSSSVGDGGSSDSGGSSCSSGSSCGGGGGCGGGCGG